MLSHGSKYELSLFYSEKQQNKNKLTNFRPGEPDGAGGGGGKALAGFLLISIFYELERKSEKVKNSKKLQNSLKLFKVY